MKKLLPLFVLAVTAPAWAPSVLATKAETVHLYLKVTGSKTTKFNPEVASDKMNEAMGGHGDEEDDEDVVLNAMARRKMRDNASYVAFTATPKPATLEKFGTKQADGSFDPFDLYSMKQAIEEGFILDVLGNYTSYKSYYELQKSIAANPLFQTQKAQKKLHAYGCMLSAEVLMVVVRGLASGTYLLDCSLMEVLSGLTKSLINILVSQVHRRNQA